MNPLSLIVLAMVALFFFQAGSTFLAFLVLIVLGVMLLSNSQSQGAAGGYGGGGHANPYVIHQQGATWPAKTKFEFRPNYPGDPDGDEWISGKAGQWVLLFGRAAKSVLGLGRDQDAHNKFYSKYLKDDGH